MIQPSSNTQPLRCSFCDAPLGESNNTLLVDGKWIHYTCAFHLSLAKINKEKKQR